MRRITDYELNQKMIEEYNLNLLDYNKMQKYYNGEHDIIANYYNIEGRSNQITVDNFVQKFIDEEVNYSLGNAITITSRTGNTDIINAINKNTFHWDVDHNQTLMKIMEIFGTVYELHYIDNKGRFCERLLNPTNAICYCNIDGVPKRFIHFYKLKYDGAKYYDVYYSDGRIEVYKDSNLIKTTNHCFKGIPVSVCKMNNISETIYYKIKTLQDAYNQVLSNQINTINDYRNAYLIVTGVDVDEETAKSLKSKGLLNLKSKDGTVSWLMKDMNDTYIQNTITDLKNAMYSTCNHIDGNFQMQSNTSSLAIRSRLLFLEQRCKSMFDYISNGIYDRLERLFEYLSIKGYNFDISDININYNPNIPTDITSTVQAISQLGDKLSLETALSLLPFVESPALEIEKIKSEKRVLESIDLDKINDYE